ncbi:TPA: GtrA family protein [Stenotrophomonas maltophilia]|uniref:GtrA family protein n=1 Tax=Stenotrophomonas maltophilia TaxID=40324 RepID=UPI000C15A905|nr:GtrA family protein [Stenotrophomonas maltophilia]MBH1384742.1 GtrA family protein [Stenotrophomonas maltophilia]MBH1426730.1 GtrA family protein [Stenotrophomonas maltophilia]MBH1499777.1 GtrA family protein [Stenotrophomonas maltophilia]MBH1535246.1 GtrA family protein [Stenotrophomonas maltophilia]MBH1878108.1 GtrA family protein [Stenotrophomonas maltophilia]
MSRSRLIFAYSVFAVVSIGVNIGAQALIVFLYRSPYAVVASVAIGTAAGLLCKYLLDKKFIFNHQSKSIAHEARTFALYIVMGLATTLLFWGTEAAFHFVFQSNPMRYLGGIIGLSIGYFIKYKLDSKFVFNTKPV